MSELSNVEKLFTVLDDTVGMIQNLEDCTYLEALSASGENLFELEVLQPYDELIRKRLMNEYNKINLKELSNEEIRKGFQLSVLKGMKEATQAHHMMTPDAVALFVGYLVNKLTEQTKSYSLLDPAVGTSNLLSALLNQSEKEVRSSAVEVDETLLRLSFINANLQQHNIEYYHQDSLQPLLIDPVDMVVCDLPVGYYPDSENSKRFHLKAEEGMSYAHHLLIEQSLNHTKDGGCLLFLVPNLLFESEQAPKLNTFIKEKANILGFLQLPLSMFKNEQMAKSILIIQKKGEGVTQPKQALLAELPSFSNKQAMQGMMQRINQWFSQENVKLL